MYSSGSQIFYYCFFARNIIKHQETSHNLLKTGENGDIISSLTLVEVKSGYKPSNYAGCSHFPFIIDLCYFFTSSVLVLFIILRMADFVINS